jgi:hypothetical protein
MTMIRFNLSLFNAAAVASSTEETRYYLMGVFCHPHPNGGVMLVATDGNILTTIWDKTGFADESAILPLTILTGWKATAKFAEQVAVWDSSAKMCSVYQSTQWAEEAPDMPERKFLVAAIDGTFPDYQRVIPKSVNAAKVKPQPFGAVLLTRVAKISNLWSAATGGPKYNGFTVAGEDGCPSLVTIRTGNNAAASAIHIVATPMRAAAETVLISPDWALAGMPADYFKSA